ncbi:major capsid protein [Vibrio harveyi]|uniref:major capsid protein n=1 Tax=Vibrio harveyi TaxID=669 RepID=UPI00217D9705|nr:hypothetical protein [Vibrio harveyi]
MALKGNGLPNIVDIMEATDANGTMPDVAMLLAEENPIILHLPFYEANEAMSHTEMVQVSLPNSEVRLFNRGVKATHGKTTKIKDGIAMFEQRAIVDVEIANLNGNSAKWRMMQNKSHLERMSQDVSDQVFYGNENSAEDNTAGLATRYNSLSGELGKYVIDAGGTTGALTSIYIVVWGEDTVNCRYPKGQSKELLSDEDNGKVTIDQGNGRRLDAYETVYKSKIGISVRDHRYVVRIANIPVANLDKKGDAVDLWDYINTAEHVIKKIRPGKTFAYMPRTVAAYLDKQSLNKENVRLKQTEVDGTLLDNSRGIYFSTCDSILETEEVVTA